MVHIRRRRESFEPSTGRPFYIREVIVGGQVLFWDGCDPKECPARDLVLEAHAEARRQRDPAWWERRSRPGGVVFLRGRKPGIY